MLFPLQDLTRPKKNSLELAVSPLFGGSRLPISSTRKIALYWSRSVHRHFPKSAAGEHVLRCTSSGLCEQRGAVRQIFLTIALADLGFSSNTFASISLTAVDR
jgi:hypothetical protein